MVIQVKPSEKLKKLSDKMNRVMEKNPSDYDFLTTEIPDQIRKRTRLGKGALNFNAGSGKLAGLSSDYKEFRAKKKGDLSNQTTPNRSNATATGQMLDSIQGTRSQLSFRFFFQGKRSKELSGSSRLSNEEVAKYYQQNGRPFFTLTKAEVNQFTRKIKDVLTKRIKNLFDA
jgi:hypothetical protein